MPTHINWSTEYDSAAGKAFAAPSAETRLPARNRHSSRVSLSAVWLALSMDATIPSNT